MANLPFLLKDLCSCTHGTNDLTGTYRYATMGLKLDQGYRRRAGYYSPEHVEAGGVEFRLFRARVHISRKEFDLAKAEIDHAKVAALEQFHIWEKTIKRAFEDLRQARDQGGQ